MPSTTDRIRARLLKLAFESLYGPFAWAYDWVSRTFFLGQWRLWQRAALPHLLGPAVLEIGIGTGNMQVDLAHAGYRTAGLDLSPQMVRRASLKVRRAGQRPQICRARAQALPFPSGHFNSVLSTFPSDYIADPSSLSEIARVLTSGGRLVIVPGGWLKPRDTKTRFMEFVAYIVYGYRAGDRQDAYLEKLQAHADGQTGPFRWIALLNNAATEAGFALSARIASNKRGACLIIVATKSEL